MSTRSFTSKLVASSVALAAAVLFITVASAATPTRDSTSAATPKRDSIKMSYFAGPSATTILVAQANGFFKRRGLNVSLIPATTGPAQLSLLLSGQVQFGQSHSILMFPQVEKGQGFKGLFSLAGGPFVSVIGRPDVAYPNANEAGLGPLRDLKGKTIGVIALGSVTDLVIRYLLKEAGLNPDKDVTIVATGNVATAVPAFSQRRVDAMVGFPLVEPLLQSQGGFHTILAPEDFPSIFQIFVNDHVVAASSYAAKNPRIIRNVCLALNDSVKWIKVLGNRTRLVDIVMHYFSGIDRNVMRATLRSLVPSIVTGDGKLSRLQVQNTNKLLLDAGLIKSAIPYTKYVQAGC